MVFPLSGYTVRTTDKAITAVFEKCQYNLDPGETFGSTPFPIASLLTRERIKGAAGFADLLGIPFQLFSWASDLPPPFPRPTETLLSIYETAIRGGGAGLTAGPTNQMSIHGLRVMLRTYRGPLNKIRALNSAASRLECYLAGTPASDGLYDPWPGDLDAMVFDAVENKVTALVEFKTHNLDKPTSEEWFGQYYTQDAYRADVLFHLRDAIAAKQGQASNLYYVVWGTGSYANHQNLKVTRLTDRANLRGTSVDTIARPAFGNFSHALFDHVTQ
ncbi:MAG: hypothetical protein ACYDDQ_02090 [Vulcanimicrobiaceae bacterium]